jgi:phosphate transport system substrate-binding protein
MSATRTALLALILCALLAAGCSAAGPAPAPAKPVPTAKSLVAGSGTNLPITAKLAEAYNKNSGANVEIPKSIGSVGAVKAVQSGAIELGLASRPLTAGEKAAGLKEIPYARVAIIFAAHPGVPDTDVTLDDIVKIHQGAKTTWSNGKPIIVLIRGLHDSSNQILFPLIPGLADAIKESLDKKRWQVMHHDIDMAENLRTKQGAFGHTDDNIASGRYPYIKPLSFIYKEALTDRAKAFVAFAASPEGQAIISANGGTPQQ